MIDRLVLILALFPAPAAQAASLWDVFVARCLEPYQHLSLAQVSSLQEQPQDQMHEAQKVFGPTEEGYLVVLDAAPDIGDRSCAVHHHGTASDADLAAFDAWRGDALAEGRYEEPEPNVLMSVEWIEPRLRLEARTTEAGLVFEVIETELES